MITKQESNKIKMCINDISLWNGITSSVISATQRQRKNIVYVYIDRIGNISTKPFLGKRIKLGLINSTIRFDMDIENIDMSFEHMREKLYTKYVDIFVRNFELYLQETQNMSFSSYPYIRTSLYPPIVWLDDLPDEAFVNIFIRYLFNDSKYKVVESDFLRYIDISKKNINKDSKVEYCLGNFSDFELIEDFYSKFSKFNKEFIDKHTSYF